MKNEMTEKELNTVTGGGKEEAAEYLFGVIKNGGIHQEFFNDMTDEQIMEWALTQTKIPEMINATELKKKQEIFFGEYYTTFYQLCRD